MAASQTSAIDTIIFDYGGVVADHYCEPYQTMMAEKLGTTYARSRELVSERSPHGKAYRLDQMSKADFWARVKELSGAQFDDDELQLLWAQTYIPNAAMISMLKFLRDKKRIRVGLCLNEDRPRWEYIVRTYHPETFSSVNVLSYEIGTVKPDPAFYRSMLEMCGRTRTPSRVLYVDDRQTHVDGAKAVGLQGYQYNNEGEFSTAVGTGTFDLLPYEP